MQQSKAALVYFSISPKTSLVNEERVGSEVLAISLLSDTLASPDICVGFKEENATDFFVENLDSSSF